MAAPIYCTLTTLKAAIASTGNQPTSADDAELTRLLGVASRLVDAYCKRPAGGFVGVTEARVFDVPPTVRGPYHAPVPRDDWTISQPSQTLAQAEGLIAPLEQLAVATIDPLLAVTSVKTDQDGDGSYEVTWLSTDYELLPQNAPADGQAWRQIRQTTLGAQRFPVGMSRLQIAGTWGEALDVPPLVEEAVILVTHRLYKRQRQAPFGTVESVTTPGGAIRVPKLDPDVCMLLDSSGLVNNWYFA